MPIVKTAHCSTATQLTEVRRDKIVLLLAGGRTFWNETGGDKDRHTSRVCLKAVFRGGTPQLSQNRCLKFCRLNTETDGNLVMDFSTKKSSLYSTQAFSNSPGTWSSQINLPKYYIIGSLWCHLHSERLAACCTRKPQDLAGKDFVLTSKSSSQGTPVRVGVVQERSLSFSIVQP